jgi:hypothetical protein
MPPLVQDLSICRLVVSMLSTCENSSCHCCGFACHSHHIKVQRIHSASFKNEHEAVVQHVLLTVASKMSEFVTIVEEASDPVRYVSDMLAWLHQNAWAQSERLRGAAFRSLAAGITMSFQVATEQDALSSLIGKESVGAPTEPAVCVTLRNQQIQQKDTERVNLTRLQKAPLHGNAWRRMRARR